MIKIRHAMGTSILGLISALMLYYLELIPLELTLILACLFFFAPCPFIFGYAVRHFNAITKKLEQEEKGQQDSDKKGL